jgi:hypothetical protein
MLRRSGAVRHLLLSTAKVRLNLRSDFTYEEARKSERGFARFKFIMRAEAKEKRMAMGRREKDIKLLVAKFIKLVESLDPGERLSIRKVASKKVASKKTAARTPGARNKPRAKPRRAT